MAKEGTEETKVEVRDIEEEFSNVMQTNTEDTPATEETTETEEKATTEEAPEAPVKEEVSEEAETAATTTEVKTWKDLGLEDFEGKSQEEIAQLIVQSRRESEHRDKVYGDQTNVVGDLRKQIAEAEAKITEVEAKKKESGIKEPDLLDQLPEMTEGEILDFNAIYEKNPVKALFKYARPVLEKMTASQVTKALEGKVEGAVDESIAQQKDNIAYTNFAGRHEDAEKFTPLMQLLDGENYLGGQKRSYEELYQLAKLGPHAQGVVADPLYQPIFQLMAKHDSMSFGEALSFAKQGTAAEEKAVEKRKEVKKTIDKIDSVNTTSKGTPKSKGTKELVTIDDEFEI